MERRAYFCNELDQSTAPFSQLVRVGDLDFVSGVIGQNHDDGALFFTDVTAQCDALSVNAETLPSEVGLELQHLMRTTL